MRRTLPLLLVGTLWGCKADSPTRVFCGTQTLDRVRFVDGDLIDQELSDQTCWAVIEDEGSTTLQRQIPGTGGPIGACTLEADSLAGPFSGDCYWWADGVQLQSHVIEGEGSAAVADETLELDLRVWTTDWNGTRVYGGRGDLLFSGTLTEEDPVSDPLVEPEPLPVCYPEDCYEGTYGLVEVAGPEACQEAVDRVAGTRHRVSRVSDFEVSFGTGVVRAAPDLQSCALHYADDEDPFDTKTFTLSEGRVYVTHYEQWTSAQTGLPVICEMTWDIPTSDCI